jgi:hypothetical protein
MEAVPLFPQVPRFAITIPRPWTWLIANGTRRDWLIATDPSPLLGHVIALHAAATGDASGWRRLDQWAEGLASRKEVRERCPHRALIGVAVVAGVDCLGRAWRLRFQDAKEVPPIGPISSGDLELWAIPGRQRELLHHHRVELRRSAVLEAGGAS